MIAFMTRPTTSTTTMPPLWPTLFMKEAMEIAEARSDGSGEHRAPKHSEGRSTAQPMAV